MLILDHPSERCIKNTHRWKESTGFFMITRSINCFWSTK